MRSGVPICEPCRRDKARYDKRRTWDVANGRVKTIPIWRVRRRAEALQRLGHSLAAINAAAGLPPRKLHSILYCSQSVTTATFKKVEVAYESLGMTLGHNARARLNAERKGWLPPLAWIDIDDPAERPDLTAIDDDLDPVVVTRILSGDGRVPANRAERFEVITRWDGSDRELEARTGWNVARLRREMSAEEGGEHAA